MSRIWKGLKEIRSNTIWISVSIFSTITTIMLATAFR